MGARVDHFAQRCRQRGIASVEAATLKRSLEAAARAAAAGDLRALDVVEHVLDTHTGAAVWRFRVAEGVFYALIGAEGHARTVITQDMLGRYKAARRTGGVSPDRWKALRAMGFSISDIKTGRAYRPARARGR